MKLYITEKPKVGYALADALPGEKTKFQTHIKCGEDVIAWAAGHLLTLYDPEDYDPRYKAWTPETLLYVPDPWQRKAIPRTKGLLATIRKLLKNVDVVVHVGDADREGQLLIDEILTYLGWKGATERLRINDLNVPAIQKALGNMQDNTRYFGEYMAGQARLYADWLVGLSLTRFVTVSLRQAGYEANLLSVGRVQTPTLGLVVRRDREIESFKTSPYYALTATLTLEHQSGVVVGVWRPSDAAVGFLDAENRIADRGVAIELARKVEAPGTVTKVETEEHRKKPPLPYSLSKLQIDASKKYDITDTLKHAQSLYEAGYITYPRTPCEYIPAGHFEDAAGIVDAIRRGCVALFGLLEGIDLSIHGRAWNNSKIKEHHAIIPTARVPLEDALNESERKIYELICARYLMQFLPDYVYNETVVEFESSGERFRAVGRSVKQIGWLGWEKAERDEDEREGEPVVFDLPTVAEGDTGSVKAEIKEKQTRPPKAYTYHSLLAGMNGIHAYVENPEIKKLLKQIEGIGTEATQEGIIKLLFKRGYLVKSKKKIASTPLGRSLIDILSVSNAASLVKPDLTALWEEQMTQIENGELTLEAFVADVVASVKETISAPLNILGEMPGMTQRKKCLTEGCDGVLRHITRNVKKPFFSCAVCNKTFNDENGEPVMKKQDSGRVVEAPCPIGCGRMARQYQGKYGSYWRCECSGEILGDMDGKPVVKPKRTQSTCPLPRCGGTATQLINKKTSKAFWKCAMCQNTFDDLDGVPVLKEGKREKASA